MIGFIDHLYTQFVTTGSYSTAANLHTLQFTVTPRSITVATSRFLATNLTQWRFFSFGGHAVARCLTPHTWNHSAIFSASFAEPNSRLTVHLELRNSTAELFITSFHGSNKNIVPNNSSIVASITVATKICLPSRYLAVVVSSGFTIPTFKRHVTIMAMLSRRHKGEEGSAT
jgi:hypothetical protein